MNVWCSGIGIRRGDGTDEGVAVLGLEEVTGQMNVWWYWDQKL